MPPKHQAKLVTAAWAAAFALPCLLAQNPPASTAAPANEETVNLSAFNVSAESADRYRSADAVSAVRVRAALIDTPSSITVLTRDMIDDIQPSRIFDATRFVAGVQDGRGMQFQDRMIIRGFESQNGARTVDNFIQAADADNIDETIIDRIEVAKGPNAILSPAGAPGGSVNIITKTPLYHRKRSVTGLIGLFDAQKLSFDATDAFAPNSPFAYRVAGSLQDSRRYWSDDSRLRGKVLAPMFAWKISNNTQFTAKLVAAEHWIFREPLLIIDSSVNAGTDDPYLAPGLSPKSRNGIQPWSSVSTHSADMFTQLTTTVNEHISLRFAGNGRYFFSDANQEFLSTPSLTNRYNPYTGVLTQDQTWALDPVSNTYVATNSPFYDPKAIPVRGDIQWTRSKTLSGQGDGVAKYNFSGFSTQTVLGAAVSRQTAYTHGKTGTLQAVDLTNPNARYYPVYPSNLQTFNKTSYTNWQYYVNERLGLLNDRIFLTGGVLQFKTRTTAANMISGALPAVLDDKKNMSSIGALGKIRDNLSIYYSHSSNSSPVIANGQPLWRDGKQDEYGFKAEFFRQRLSFTGAYFEIEQTNVTVPNPDRQTNPSAPEQLLSDLTNKGYEFELMGSVTKNLSAVATYSHLNMRDKLGRQVRGVADNLAALLLNYRITEGEAKGLSLNAGVTYTGKRAGDTPINFTQLGVVGKVSFFLKPMYSTTVGASYRWNRYLFRLNVDNPLNDKDYIMIAGSRVSGTGITTAPGINVKFATTIEF